MTDKIDYKITIENRYDDEAKILTQKFSSKEEKDQYINEEYNYCKNEIRLYNAAMTKECREAAGLSLYRARKAFRKYYRETNK